MTKLEKSNFFKLLQHCHHLRISFYDFFFKYSLHKRIQLSKVLKQILRSNSHSYWFYRYAVFFSGVTKPGASWICKADVSVSMLSTISRPKSLSFIAVFVSLDSSSTLFHRCLAKRKKIIPKEKKILTQHLNLSSGYIGTGFSALFSQQVNLSTADDCYLRKISTFKSPSQTQCKNLCL